MRVFIAIDLEPAIKSALEALVRDLKATRADVRWVGAGGMHLTLKFLGPVEENRADLIKGILDDIGRRHAPVPLRLEGTGAFPPDRNPRVLWAGVSPEPALSALQKDLEDVLASEGFEREPRAFTPHLTLGRVKGPGRMTQAMAVLEAHRSDVFGAMTARKIALFESVLRPQGAEYRIVHEAGLT